MSLADIRAWHRLMSDKPTPATPADPNQMALGLFEPEAEPDPYEAKLLEWIELNADTWAAMVSRAHAYARMGHTFGANSLVEFARGEYMLNTPEGELFGLNNNHAPAIARLLCDRYPDLAPFIRTRAARQDLFRSDRRAG